MRNNLLTETNMIRSLIIAIVALLFVVQGTIALQCYECDFTTPNRGQEFCLKNDHNVYPATSIKASCLKCSYTTGKDGVQVRYSRRCLRNGDQGSEDENGCTKREEGNWDKTTCLCAKDLCNVIVSPEPSSASSGVVIHILAFILVAVLTSISGR